ncbi:MAG: hypothetical protein Q8P00_05305 [Dehalococcoidia bacterium]|nr:hypothetical protein [Dehalococcoidia bacterium]
MADLFLKVDLSKPPQKKDKAQDSYPIEFRCRLWQTVGEEVAPCAGRFYPNCGGNRRWYPCRHQYPLKDKPSKDKP